MENIEKLNLSLGEKSDFETFAPYVQDALVPLSLVVYTPLNKTFELQMNRFCWEHLHKKEHLRIHSHFLIHKVQHAERRGFDLDFAQRTLNLLTLFVDNTDNHHVLYLIFSDHREIRLCLDGLEAYVWDFNEHWPASSRPKHVFEYTVS